MLPALVTIPKVLLDEIALKTRSPARRAADGLAKRWQRLRNPPRPQYPLAQLVWPEVPNNSLPELKTEKVALTAHRSPLTA